MQSDRRRCLAAGMDGYLARPIRSAEVATAIEGILPAKAAGESADPPPAGTRVWDRAALLGRLDGDAAGLGDIIATALQEYPDRLCHMKVTLASADCERLAELAHALKGSAATLCAQDASDGAAALEQRAEASDLPGAARAYEALVQEISRLAAALRKVPKECENESARRG